MSAKCWRIIVEEIRARRRYLWSHGGRWEAFLFLTSFGNACWWLWYAWAKPLWGRICADVLGEWNY